MTVGQALATRERLTRQTLDTGQRGKGGKAARRAAALKAGRGDGHMRGLSRSNQAQSRRQQRLLFARYGKAAKQWTTRGRYAGLPERKAARA